MVTSPVVQLGNVEESSDDRVPDGKVGGLNKHGFSTIELVVAVLVLCILSAISIHPVLGLINRIRLQNAADGVKHYLMTARIRAVSNPNRHCGVVFRLHSSAAITDTVFGFLDQNPPDNIYTSGVDSLYLKPFLITKKFNVTTSIDALVYPKVIAFRGDGSASASLKIVFALGTLQDTVTVLASTGKVKRVTK